MQNKPHTLAICTWQSYISRLEKCGRGETTLEVNGGLVAELPMLWRLHCFFP